MKQIDPAFERKLLLDVVTQLKDPEQALRRQIRYKQLLYGIGSFGLLSAFFLALNNLAHPVLTAFVAGLAGCAAGFALFLENTLKQWPVSMRHIDMNSVRARLDELENRQE